MSIPLSGCERQFEMGLLRLRVDPIEQAGHCLGKKADLLDDRPGGVDIGEVSGLDAFRIMQMAQRQKLVQCHQFPAKGPRQLNRRRSAATCFIA